MLVRGSLEIPPDEKRTVIPRASLVINTGHFYVYLKAPGDTPRFRRVEVAVAQEKDDYVVVDSGLKAGDDVVSVGSLILDQMFDNAEVTRAAEVPATFEVQSG